MTVPGDMGIVVIVADESIGHPIVERLRHEGYHVRAIEDVAPSVDDDIVLDIAARENALRCANPLRSSRSDPSASVHRRRLLHSWRILNMATNDYHFITTWRVPGTAREVSAILGDAADLPRWWPSVYLDVRELEPGDENGIGKVVDLYTKGWLPYTLRWKFRVTESNPPHGFALVADGDFVGRGIWTLTQDGDMVDVVYDWKIRADKPLLRSFSFVMKPIFAANHRWAMARGEESLKIELARRHTATAAERARVPAPPGPTSASPFALLAGISAIALAAGTLLARRRRGERLDAMAEAKTPAATRHG